MWYIVLSRSLPEKEADKQSHYEEHRLWLDDQHRAGRLLLSGPTTDGGLGIYIMLASSLSKRRKSQLRIRTIFEVFARCKCWNGERIAPSG